MKYFLLFLALYLLIRFVMSYVHYRSELYLHRTIMEYLDDFCNDYIASSLAYASAKMACQQYADAYNIFSMVKNEYELQLNPEVLEKIDLDVNFCKSPISDGGQPINRQPSWLHYIDVKLFGHHAFRFITKELKAEVASWVKAGKPKVQSL